MTAQEVYEAIRQRELFEFKAKEPFSVVRNSLSRHSVENTHSCASKNKYFQRVDGTKYKVLPATD